jgi:regulator of replication initiation timing
MTLSGRVDDMALKMTRIAELMQQLREENHALRTANEELAARLDAAVVALEQARALHTEEERQETRGPERPTTELSDKLKEDIEHYIAEIDKCIDWLRNH